MGISRRCASKWWHRYLELGADGLHDRSSRPRCCPTRTPARIEQRIVRHRLRDKVGPDRIAARLGVPASTVHRVLVRHDLHRLSHLDRQTAAPIRRYEKYCRPYRPQTNGKVERLHRTLLEEWAYVRPYTCEGARTRALASWLHRYNHHRMHTAVGLRRFLASPTSRGNGLSCTGSGHATNFIQRGLWHSAGPTVRAGALPGEPASA